MNFELNNVYSVINADKIRIGSIGYSANNYRKLEFLVTHNSKNKKELICVNDNDCIVCFTVRNRYAEKTNCSLFYFLKESKNVLL